jgi:hypothetical protein
LLSRSFLLTTNNNTTAPKTAVTTLTLKPPTTAPEILMAPSLLKAADNTNDYVANDTKTTTADN